MGFTMPDYKRSATDQDVLRVLAGHARLDLSADRAAAVVPALDGILQLLDSLDEVELGEGAPAFAYRAKWER